MYCKYIFESYHYLSKLSENDNVNNVMYSRSGGKVDTSFLVGAIMHI